MYVSEKSVDVILIRVSFTDINIFQRQWKGPFNFTKSLALFCLQLVLTTSLFNLKLNFESGMTHLQQRNNWM